MKLIVKKLNVINVTLLVVLAVSAFLRFYNLSYSDYQGDEIKALFNVRNNKDFFEFIFDQKKGPNQFLLTNALRGVSNDYYNYLVMRMPFAVAGFFAVILFYLIVKNFYNEKVALYATIFFGSSGFLIAFSRIVQYQSFVILLGLLTIYLGQKFAETKKYLYLYLAYVSLALGILFHYDGVFFAIPFFGIILKEYLSERKNKKLIVNIILAKLLFVLILGSFYIPFVLNINSAALSYFQERIEGVGGEAKISSTLFIFNLYQPYFSLYIYIILGIAGVLSIFKNLKDFKNIFLMAWILFPAFFMEFLIKSPGTHIYTYLIPLFILLGIGVEFVFNLSKVITYKFILDLMLLAVSVHLFLQSYVLFVENSKEYPWQDKKYLYFDLKALTQDDNKKYYLSLFGFPYNRNWLEIKEYLKNTQGNYDSSEKSTIGNFYLKHLNFENYGEIYVEIETPQSFSRANRREFTPVKVFENQNGTKSLIYFLK